MAIKRRTRLRKGHLDMTPLIDVVFLLLIFFMLSSSFIVQPGIKVDLPEAISAERIPKDENILITLTGKGHIYMNDALIQLENLLTALMQSEKSSVIIQADQSVALEHVVEVWDKCRQAGIKQLNIATHQKRD